MNDSIGRPTSTPVRPKTDRAVPEPDAERVERAAKALCDFDVESNGRYRWEDRSDEWYSAYEYGRNHYRDMARAALQAAAVEPEPGLDELLDSVNQKAMISFVFQHDSEPWIAGVRWPYTDELPIDSQTFASANGTGPTRMAAIADAVRQAKENGDG